MSCASSVQETRSCEASPLKANRSLTVPTVLDIGTLDQEVTGDNKGEPQSLHALAEEVSFGNQISSAEASPLVSVWDQEVAPGMSEELPLQQPGQASQREQINTLNRNDDWVFSVLCGPDADTAAAAWCTGPTMRLPNGSPNIGDPSSLSFASAHESSVTVEPVDAIVQFTSQSPLGEVPSFATTHHS
jgi:hypothetical protein